MHVSQGFFGKEWRLIDGKREEDGVSRELFGDSGDSTEDTEDSDC